MFIKNSLAEKKVKNMNMSKRILLVCFTIFMMFLFKNNVLATDPCSQYTNKTECDMSLDLGIMNNSCIWIDGRCIYYKNMSSQECSFYPYEHSCKMNKACVWKNNACVDEFVAENPCQEVRIKKAFRFFGYLLTIAKIAIPLIIVVMGTFDFYKSVVDKDDKSLSKQTRVFLIRIVTGIVIFFIPTIVYALFNLSSSLNIVSDQKYKACVDCLLDPNNNTKCKIEETN